MRRRSAPTAVTEGADLSAPPTVFVVDDDPAVRAVVQRAVESVNLRAALFGNAKDFLAAYDPAKPGCLVLDVRLPGMSGLELQARLAARHVEIPVIIISGYADVSMAVEAMRAGAMDFIEKPFSAQGILERIQQAIEYDRRVRHATARVADFSARVAKLSPREREVMNLLVEGRHNKQIATLLALSRKTIETHRANLMSKMGVHSLAELIRLNLLVVQRPPLR